MKLKNNTEEFIVVFCGKDYKIPSGEFEVFSETLGLFILNKARKWNKDITTVTEKKTEDIRIEVKSKISQEIIKQTKETKVQKSEEKQDKLKNSQKIEELTNSL
ncbi:MAG: hypothetical protein WC938_03555 [Candidatus Paceibacterota bacterium]|jgi:hypothetical protein